MANQPEEIQIKIDTAIDNASTAKTIKDLKKAIQELKGAAAELGPEAGEAFETATAAAAEFQDRIDDVNDALKNAKGEGIEGMKSGFGDLKTALGNLDFDKAGQAIDSMNANFNKINFSNISANFDTFKTKVGDFADNIKSKIGENASGTMKGFGNIVGGVSKSITSALSGDMIGAIGGVGTSLKGLGQIILANPLLTLATVIVGLVANFEKFKDMGGALGEIFNGVSSVVENVTKGFKSFTDAIGLTNFAGEKLAKQQKDLSEKRLEYSNKANQKAAEEMVNLRILYDAATNANIPLKDRIELSEELQNLYPEIFANYTAEQIALGKSTVAFEKLNAQILKTAYLEAYKAELVDVTTEIIKNQKAVDAARDTYGAIRNFTAGTIPSVFAKQNSDAVAVIDANNQNLKRQSEILNEISKIVGETTVVNSKAEKEIKKSVKETTTEIKFSIDYFKKFLDEVISVKGTDLQGFYRIKSAIEEFNEGTKKSDLSVTEFFDTLLLGNKILSNMTGAYDLISQRISVLTNQKEALEQKQSSGNKLTKEEVKEYERLNVKIQEQETFLKKLNDLKENLNTNKKTITKNYVLSEIAANEKLLENEKLTSDESLRIAKTLALEKLELEEIEANGDAIKLANIAKRKKLISSELEKENDAYKLQRKKSVLDSLMDAVDLFGSKDVEKANIKEKYNIEREELDNWHTEELERARGHSEEMYKIDAEYKTRRDNLNEQERQANISANISATTKNIALAEGYLVAVQGLTDAIFDYKINRLEKGSEAELKAAKTQFNINKGLQLAIATTSGIMSVMAAIENGMKNPVPLLGPATAAVYGVGAGIAAAANIAKIAATKFNPGGGGAGSSAASVPTMQNLSGSATDLGAKSSSISAPQLFDVGNTSYNNERSTLRVAVVEGDIRTAMNKVNVLESASYFNGP